MFDSSPAGETGTANSVFYRTYSRRLPGGARENWQQMCDRTLAGLVDLGKLTDEEAAIVSEMQRQIKALPSGRWMWVGGTDWLKKPENFYGAYNCTSTRVVDVKTFGLMMGLAMQGCGTGAVLTEEAIANLPPIRNKIAIKKVTDIGAIPAEKRRADTDWCFLSRDGVVEAIVIVGDSRNGWTRSLDLLLQMATGEGIPPDTDRIDVIIDLGNIRPAGEPLKGFGGVANPVKLAEMYGRIANVLNRAIGRKLNSVEACLVLDEAAIVIVAGNIRRSAGIKQFSSDDEKGATAKDNLWQQDTEGNWRIDPDRDALRMSNHTRVFHRKPTLEECVAAVQKQYYSGEGAIQWAGEAVARANADLLVTGRQHGEFVADYEDGRGREYLERRSVNLNLGEMSDRELDHRMARFGLNPCGEIIGSDFMCNLAEIHLNRIDPHDCEEQKKAFSAGALSVAALLNHQFDEPRYQYSRELDPIVGVSFTGLFDFFVNLLGVDWLLWWEAGRPAEWKVANLEAVESIIAELAEHSDSQYWRWYSNECLYKRIERSFLTLWKSTVHQIVWEYSDRHGLKRPNRCTTVQPSGSKSLLTGASPGWHPPKAQRFIRRITFRKNDPVALACIDFGYNVLPSQSDKDETGKLLDDPFDPRCSEWLVEIPVEVPWANLPGADAVDISRFSALAQFDFYLMVQQHYTTHNTSATIELRESEVEALGKRIHTAIQEDEGYISAALLARFDDLQTFPRLPFEPIDKQTYDRIVSDVLKRRVNDDFHAALLHYDSLAGARSAGSDEPQGPAGCDSDKCLLPETAFKT
jgi:ribonucleotide reductase, class II